MKTTTDRVMQAFSQKYPITDDQARAIRQEVSSFVAELLKENEKQLSFPTLLHRP